MKRINLPIRAALIAGTFAFAACRQTTPTESTETRQDTVAVAQTQPAAGKQWTKAQAQQWYGQTGWLAGSNFAPSNAINQLEMWQAETFDTATINRELGWAEDLGFNSMRVFLHDMLWEQDSVGLLQRADQFMAIADRHNIGVMFVLFDGVWDPEPKLGKQRAPKQGLHNSGWVQSPGSAALQDTTGFPRLERYVKGVMRHYANDKRVQVWDMFNEPDNDNKNSYGAKELPNKAEVSLRLLKKSYQWARQVNPSQPITSGVWHGDYSDSTRLTPMDEWMLKQSDVISFHEYGGPDKMQQTTQALQQYGRPLLCTEYMARKNESTFQGILPLLKQYNVSAYNWGFVAGKTNTIYPWDSWQKAYRSEPPVWFHDIFRANGNSYRAEEVAAIKRVTGVSK